MNREHWKLSSAVWLYFLFLTMATSHQLGQHKKPVKERAGLEFDKHNEKKTSTESQEQRNQNSKGDWPALEKYGDWSGWSACHPHTCTQTRSKHCTPGAHCGGVVLKEERPCNRSHQVYRRYCDKVSRKRKKHKSTHRRRKPPFHVVKSDKRKSVRKIGARSGDLVGDTGDGEEDNVISLRGEYKKAYSRWSRWTICTKSCTTQRYRWCKRPVVCGKDVIRETAFCYQEGSQCHAIHKNMMRRGTDDNSIYNDRGGSTTHGYSIDPVPVNPRVSQGECGLVANYSGRPSYSANMLRIIGGRPTQHGRWPWQVAILNRFKEAFCGGTLIAAQWVLTAAHCVRKRLYVRLGEYDLTEREGTEQELRVEYAVTHPQYDIDTVDNDLALLHLPTPVQMDQYRGIACLPRARQPLPARRFCTIIGWGKRRTTDMFGTDVLQEAQVPIVSNEVCRGVYEDYHITGNMFCAGDRRGRHDSCAGDSGGPLLCRDPASHRWTVLGITSFGEGCGKRGKYGIYTRLPNYVRWVHRVMKTYTTV